MKDGTYIVENEIQEKRKEGQNEEGNKMEAWRVGK